MSLRDFDRNVEKKIGRYAIRNLSLVLIICYLGGYFINYINASFLNYLTLNPYLILHGQIWRLVTWVIIPPQTSSPFFMLIMLLFYYSIGTALERTWGTYRYNVYMFTGMLFTILGAFVMMAYAYIFKASMIESYGTELFFAIAAQYFSTYYINMSIFLAYAVTFPDMQVLLMFIIPVRVKWLGILYAAYLIYDGFMGNFITRIALVASLLNFLVLFFTSRDLSRFDPRERKRRQNWKNAVNSAPGGKGWTRGEDGWMHGSGNSGQSKAAPGATGASAGTEKSNVIHHDFRHTVHQCAVCGRTELDDPDIEFRYCSKCEGNYEYCMDHIHTHMHVKNGDRSSFDGNGHVKMMPQSDADNGKV